MSVLSYVHQFFNVGQCRSCTSTLRIIRSARASGKISPFHYTYCIRLVKKPKRMFSPAFADLPSPAQRLDFLLAITHTHHA